MTEMEKKATSLLISNFEKLSKGFRKEKGKAGIFVKGDHVVLIIGFEGSRPL